MQTEQQTQERRIGNLCACRERFDTEKSSGARRRLEIQRKQQRRRRQQQTAEQREHHSMNLDC